MISDDDRARLRFELANANLQSVSRAQGLYLTTLLVYICLIWAMFLTGTATIHLESLELKIDTVWQITPFIIMVLTLAVVGTLNATNSAYTELKEVGTKLFGSDFGTLSFATSYWAVRQASFHPQSRFFLICGWVCLFVQLIYSARRSTDGSVDCSVRELRMTFTTDLVTPLVRRSLGLLAHLRYTSLQRIE
jgi:hypothetical protein